MGLLPECASVKLPRYGYIIELATNVPLDIGGVTMRNNGMQESRVFVCVLVLKNRLSN